jgi:hypothetical protein
VYAAAGAARLANTSNSVATKLLAQHMAKAAECDGFADAQLRKLSVLRIRKYTKKEGSE